MKLHIEANAAGAAVLLIAVLLISEGHGASGAVTAAVVALIVAAALVMLAALGVVALLVHRSRQEVRMMHPAARQVITAEVRELPAPAASAIEQPDPDVRAGGTGAEQAAGIPRRLQSPEHT